MKLSDFADGGKAKRKQIEACAHQRRLFDQPHAAGHYAHTAILCWVGKEFGAHAVSNALMTDRRKTIEYARKKCRIEAASGRDDGSC